MAKRQISAPPESQKKRPAHWEKRVSAAYMRMLGATQAEAGRAVGRSERTIRLWESDPSWADARREAEERWLVDLTDASRRAVLDSIKAGNAQLAKEMLERLDERLAPPTIKHKLSGRVGMIHILANLPDAEIERLESLSDEELAVEIERLEAGADGDA